ncbi:MAG: DUF255 domain-containing protein [Planctomycetia bacterium]|nr:DUF255 domain-containing protein [Planctomycetia bacterium]
MRASLRFHAASIMLLGLCSATSAIEPVGSASRGIPEGESSRRNQKTVVQVAATSAPEAKTAAAAVAAPVAWQTNVEEACRLARQNNLPVLVFVTSAQCPYCVKMKDQTFRTATVVQELGAKFVPLRVERGSSPALERQLGVKSYPTTVVLRSDKVEVARMAGFIPAPQFLGNLKKVEAQWTVLNASRPIKTR